MPKDSGNTSEAPKDYAKIEKIGNTTSFSAFYNMQVSGKENHKIKLIETSINLSDNSAPENSKKP